MTEKIFQKLVKYIVASPEVAATLYNCAEFIPEIITSDNPPKILNGIEKIGTFMDKEVFLDSYMGELYGYTNRMTLILNNVTDEDLI